jgi:hypothetical protein
MNTNQDNKWQSLLALSAPTFSADSVLPYGFMTAALAQLRSEQQQERQIGQICWRAIFASVAVLILSVGVTISVHRHFNRGDDLDPGTRGFVQVENVQAL